MTWDVAGPVITGNGMGVNVLDGSFLRSDNVTITFNDIGIRAHRNSTIKVYNQEVAAQGVSHNTDTGIWLQSSSTAHIGAPITDNGVGISVGPLSLAEFGGATTFLNNVTDLTCEHPTSVVMGFGGCPSPRTWDARR